MAKYNQIYGRPNYIMFFKHDVWPKILSKPCQNKCLWSASHLTWSMWVKLSTLPPLTYPLITLGASKMKFYNLIYTRSVDLTVRLICIRMSKMPSKVLTSNWFSGHFFGHTRQYLVKFAAQFYLDNKEKIWWFEKMAIFAADHLISGRPFCRLWL